MNDTATLRPAAAGIDWPSLRFPGEAELRREVEKRSALLELVERWADPLRAPRGWPAGWFHGGVEAGPGLCPALHRLAAVLRQVFRQELQPAVVVLPADAPFAEMLPAPADSPDPAPWRLGVAA